jgi:DNA-binding winged helix-turn-helix (wHTH) protein/TolB-like protein/Flp pilus assembly protein TadD
MSQTTNIYQFGPFEVDVAERLLWRNGQPVALTARAFDTLLLLVRHPGHLVEKSELLHEVWNDAFVEDGNIAVTVFMLRKALGENGGTPQYIQTVSKRGYRFIAKVHIVPTENGCSRGVGAVDRPEIQNAELLPGIALAKSATVMQSKRRPALWIAGGVVSLIVCVSAAMVFARLSTTRAARPGIRSIAVLPFRVSPPDPRTSGLAIADAIITDLGANTHIDVRPTSAIQQYTSAATDPVIVGRTQKVDAVLIGTVVPIADGLLMDVRLVRVADASLIWAERFEQTTQQRSLFVDEMAERVVSALETRLDLRTGIVAGPRQQQNAKAYQLYVQGRYFWNKRTEEGLRRSIEYFQQATLEDQQYAAAYAGLADSYALLASYGVEPAEQAYPNAKAAASKALKLDPSLAEAYTSLGMISFYYEWNWLQAERQFQRSIALNPTYPLAHTWYALDLAAMGRCPEAIAQIQRAHDLDPLSLSINTEVGRVFYWCRQGDRAVDALRKAIDLDPYFARAHTRLGMAYAAQQDFRGAIREFEQARTLSGRDPYLDGLLAYALASSGQTRLARTALSDLIRRSHGQFVPAFSVALVCIGLGDRDLALDWLAKAYQDRSTYMVYAKSDPLLDPIRRDPRFSALLNRLRLNDPHGSVIQDPQALSVGPTPRN